VIPRGVFSGSVGVEFSFDVRNGSRDGSGQSS
jgi:hypothetical protein